MFISFAGSKTNKTYLNQKYEPRLGKRGCIELGGQAERIK